MESKYLLFLFLMTIVSCIASWGIVERERKYAKLKLPKIMKAILFPFKRNYFTFHNIVYVIIFYIIDILFIIFYFKVTDKELVFSLYMLAFFILLFVQGFIFMLLELKYWLINRNKPRL